MFCQNYRIASFIQYILMHSTAECRIINCSAIASMDNLLEVFLHIFLYAWTHELFYTAFVL